MAGWDAPASIKMHTPTETPEETGFWENANAAWEQVRREELPIYSPAQEGPAREYQLGIIDKYSRDGTLAPEVLEHYDSNSGMDMNGLTNYMKNELGLSDVVTEKEFEQNRNENYTNLRAEEEKVFAAQNKMGFVGEQAGGAASYVHDPIYVGGLVLGYGVAGTALEATIMSTAATSGVIEMGVEALATPAKMSFKKELGLQYGASEAVVNILAAGAFGAGAGALGKFVSNQFAKLNPSDMTVDEAIERMMVFSEKGHNNEIAPVLHVLAKADPNESALTVLTRDEKISLSQNNRGAKKGADPRAEAERGHVDDAELSYDAMKANQEKIAADAVKETQSVKEGVPQGTPSTKAPLTKKPKFRDPAKETPAQKKFREQWDAENPKIKAYPEDTHPAVAAKYDEVADIDERLAVLEEVC